jgi:hypothetical protein
MPDHALIYPDVPIAKYVADDFGNAVVRAPSLSSSVAHRLLTRSPAHAREIHARLNPTWTPSDDARFDLGTAAHAVILEGKRELVVSLPFENYKTKLAQTARDSARAQGLIPLLTEQADAVTAMAVTVERAMAASPDLRDLGPLDAEHTILWREGDVTLRCRPDWLTRDRAIILSLKTSHNAEPDAFTRTLLNLGYDVQCAFEMAAVQALTGREPRYLWVVVEPEPPFAVSLVGPSPMLLDLGRAKYDRALSIWRECLATGQWPAYPDRICYVEPPPWAMTTAPLAPDDLDDGRPLHEQLGIA